MTMKSFDTGSWYTKTMNIKVLVHLLDLTCFYTGQIPHFGNLSQVHYVIAISFCRVFPSAGDPLYHEFAPLHHSHVPPQKFLKNSGVLLKDPPLASLQGNTRLWGFRDRNYLLKSNTKGTKLFKMFFVHCVIAHLK